MAEVSYIARRLAAYHEPEPTLLDSCRSYARPYPHYMSWLQLLPMADMADRKVGE
jgi:hypothetical protein